MPKNKSHKGLLKRIRVSKSGLVKVGRAYARHLKSHKPAALVRQYRRGKYLTSSEAKRLSNMLHTRLRGIDVPRPARRRRVKAETT
ncbi:MAG: 50S ribosomal protein L35 [Phycisphaeraceae bacterium]|nr:50S ribosomal protein L35 [Phycisphaerales bacterium]QOJ18168.1 MAG: 50S ribosomal protein L35 [Phycisphaeraceae bacterium]